MKADVAIGILGAVLLGLVDLVSTPDATASQVEARVWMLVVFTGIAMGLLISNILTYKSDLRERARR